MLHIPTAFDNATQPPAAKTVTGQFLARNKRDKRFRAKLAADIASGNVRVGNLTIGQTAYLCRVSRSYVDAIRKPLTPSETLGQHFARATTDERIEFARTVGVDVIWDELVHPLV